MQPKVNTSVNLGVVPKDKIHTLLEPGEFGLMLDWKVISPNGQITSQGSKKSESFVRQFLDLLQVQFALASYNCPVSTRDTGNTLRDVVAGCTANDGTFPCNGGAGVVTHGIVVGTGSTAPTISDYVMETLIAHGVGAGQLQYGAVTYGAPASDATTSQFTITRNFANGSGGAITVNEAGLYVRALDSGYTVRYFMTVRDVIGGGISVPNGQTLTLNYRPQAVI